MKDYITNSLRDAGRQIAKATPGDVELGPFKDLPGRWESLPGRGWNMIALPFSEGQFNYRLLMNQYNEELNFNVVDKGIPNRGIQFDGSSSEADQFLVALDYEQKITQIAAEDVPASTLAGGADQAIHHEPGLFLHMTNETTDGIDIARLATVPHGDSVLALGQAAHVEGGPDIPMISGLPIGVPGDLDQAYLAPYQHFHEVPFRDLFDPVSPNSLLQRAIEGTTILRTTRLTFDTRMDNAGISNIPFVTRQANATEMQSTFWIEELAETDGFGRPVFQMQYSQVVMLDFFPRPDGEPGLIRWPHVSINTLRRVGDI